MYAIFYFQLLGWNLVGAVAIFAWSAVLSAILFGILKCAGILRVSKEVEIKGNYIFFSGVD